MGEEDDTIPRGSLEGKKIELASTAGIAVFQAIVEEFMSSVFGYEPGEYLITDESSLGDFVGVNDMKLADIQHKIWDIYGLDVSRMPTRTLLEIFIRLHDRQSYDG